MQEDCIGVGTATRSYEWILDRNFVHIRNHSETPSADTAEAPNVHMDWGFLSYDQIRKKVIFREFHNEAYVNQYVLDSISSDKKHLVFNSEALENVPAGWRARVTIIITGDDTFLEFFELARPGMGFETYLKGTWTRKPRLPLPPNAAQAGLPARDSPPPSFSSLS